MRKSKLFLELEREKRKNQDLEKENAELKRLLDAELQAKENGCHRGNYCGNCKHAVLVSVCGKTTCYCTFGQCKHFEKEHHIIEGEL